MSLSTGSHRTLIQWAASLRPSPGTAKGGLTEMMNEAAREARRAYKREWNRRNKDKVKAAQERYWQRRAEAIRDQSTDDTDQQQEA